MNCESNAKTAITTVLRFSERQAVFAVCSIRPRVKYSSIHTLTRRQETLNRPVRIRVLLLHLLLNRAVLQIKNK